MLSNSPLCKRLSRYPAASRAAAESGGVLISPCATPVVCLLRSLPQSMSYPTYQQALVACRLTTACSRRPSQSSNLHTQICRLSGARLMLAVRRH